MMRKIKIKMLELMEMFVELRVEALSRKIEKVTVTADTLYEKERIMVFGDEIYDINTLKRVMDQRTKERKKEIKLRERRYKLDTQICKIIEKQLELMT